MKHNTWHFLIATLFFALSVLTFSCPDICIAKTVQKKTSQAISDATTQSSKPQDPDAERELWLNRAQKNKVFTGKASWYGRDFHNKATASGVKYDMHTFTAAHRTLPLGTVVKVTDQANGKSVMVCVTDRGPYVGGRIIDLSFAAAEKLGLSDRGVSKVELEVVSDETGVPLQHDQAYFIRYPSENGKNTVGPFEGFDDAIAMHEALSQAHPQAEVVLEHKPD